MKIWIVAAFAAGFTAGATVLMGVALMMAAGRGSRAEEAAARRARARARREAGG